MKVDTFIEFLLEFTNKDKEFIKSLDKYFTVAIEYEIVSTEDPSEEPAIEDEEKALEHTRRQTLLDLSRGKTVGIYQFSADKWPQSRFEENEKQMYLENPKFDKLSAKKQSNLHSKYKTWTWVNEFLDELQDLVDFDDQDETEDALAEENFTDELERIIARRFGHNADEFCFEQNIEYLIGLARKTLPKFWKKWGNTFKFELEGDSDKTRILEFSPKTYIQGLSAAVEQINDFYDDFEKQNKWILNNRAALHINIGAPKGSNWNALKGLLFMGEYGRESKTPYVFKNIEWRMDSTYTKSLLDVLLRDFETDEIYQDNGKVKDRAEIAVNAKIKELNKELKTAKGKRKKELQDEITKLKSSNWNLVFRKKENIFKNKQELFNNLDLSLRDTNKFEEVFNDYLIKSNADFYQKAYGVKLTEIPYYIEFRFLGGKPDAGKVGGITREIMLDKLYYFCYIVYAMTNEGFKRQDYLKKLYKFVQVLKSKLNKNED